MVRSARPSGGLLETGLVMQVIDARLLAKCHDVLRSDPRFKRPRRPADSRLRQRIRLEAPLIQFVALHPRPGKALRANTADLDDPDNGCELVWRG